jgi:nucleotide-binding universal stress UspA family protein
LTSHGRTGLSRLLMGSTAERIVRHARGPVLVLKSFKESTAA